MSDYFRIDEGYTYEYLVHGLGVFVLAVFMLLIHWSIAVSLLVISIGMMVIKTGIELNYKLKTIRKYKRFLGIKFGRWLDLNQFKGAELHYNINQVPYNTVSYPVYISRKPGSINTYDLILIDFSNNKLILNPFLKFSAANLTLEALQKSPHINIRNFAKEVIDKRKNAI